MDERLRRLQRDVHQGRAELHELLRQQILSGELPREKVQLAAVLGDASAALIDDVPAELEMVELLYRLRGWPRGNPSRCSPLGKEAAARTGVAFARHFEARGSLSPAAPQRQVLIELERWCLCPCDPCRTRLDMEYDHAPDFGSDLVDDTGSNLLTVLFEDTLRDTVEHVLTIRQQDPEADPLKAPLWGVKASSYVTEWRETFPGETTAGAAVAPEVVPWLLGLGDPLRDRVEGA